MTRKYTPTIRLSLQTMPVVVGQPIVVNISANDQDRNLASGSLDWGDGSPKAAWLTAAPTSLTHTYAKAGSYTMMGLVVDKTKLQGTATVVVVVDPLPVPVPVPVPTPTPTPTPAPTHSVVIASPLGGTTVTSGHVAVQAATDALVAHVWLQVVNGAGGVVAAYAMIATPQQNVLQWNVDAPLNQQASGTYTLVAVAFDAANVPTMPTTSPAVPFTLDNGSVPTTVPTPDPIPVPVPDPTPTPLPPVVTPDGRRVLTSADVSWLGAMRVPAAGIDMVFSYGPLTGRKVNGTVQLLMVGSVTAGDPIYEFADTGIYSKDISSAPRMALVRAWGDVYGSCRKTWHADGTEKTGYPRYPGGLCWNERTQLLYWVFVDSYNTTGDPDWCLGATRLDAAKPAAFGPWRPSGDGKKGPWRCTKTAMHPSGKLLCGSGVMAGNAGSPWGPDVWVGEWPTETTPAGFTAPDLPIAKYLTYPSMLGNINLDGSVITAPVRSCRRPGDYVFEPINGQTSPTEIDPTKNKGTGSWTQVDALGGLAWIDLPDVHGVLFTGRLGAGHVWYRNAGMGNDLCTHGLSAPVVVTGPVSTDAYPVMMFFNPDDLENVRLGTKVDYTVDPIDIANVQAQFGIQTAPITEMGSAKHIGGSYFDPETRKLYVCAPQADATILGLLNPVVHVFQVA